MRALALLAIAACGGTSDLATVGPQDSGFVVESICVCIGCSVLTQAGCGPSEKCTWVLATDPTETTLGLGADACAPAGPVAIGEACTTEPVAMGGYDNCVVGAVCVLGHCEQICDPLGGAPTCPAMQTCITRDGLFANAGATSTPAGVCERSCDPITDNDVDGSGSAHTKTGTTCGSDPLIGCYGAFSHDAAHPTHFNCGAPYPGTEHLTNRSPVPANEVAWNSCAPGYFALATTGTDGSITTACAAYCRPGDAYLGAPSQHPNGIAGHACNPTDEQGTFGATPDGSATSNGEHCMYSWFLELGPDGTGHTSPTSNSVGICIDHTLYRYDSNGDGAVDSHDEVIPPCASLPLHGDVHGPGAVDFGCVSTTTAGTPTARLIGAAR